MTDDDDEGQMIGFELRGAAASTPETSSQRGPAEAAAVAAAMFLVGLIPGLGVPLWGLRAGAAIAGLAGFAAGLSVPRRAVGAIALALVPTSLAVSSQILPLDGRYLPFAACATALLVGVLRNVRRGDIRFRIPPASVALSLAAYLVWVLVASLASIDRGTSLIYLVGAGASFVIAFVLAPTSIPNRAWTRWFLVALAASAVGLVVLSVILAVVGPVPLFGQFVGLYTVAEIVVGGQPTGLVVLRATGPYSVPADVALALAIGLVALLALREGAGRLTNRVNLALIVIVSIGLLLTMARSGWLVAAVATGGYALLRLAGGRIERAAMVVTVFFVAASILLSVNALGARLRTDLAADRYGRNIAALLPGADSEANVDAQFRGGTDLSGRPLIWVASIQAIRARPIIGWGPGTNPEAIAPYLTGSAARFRGLTSHNTWLRAAVELGIPGVLAFFAFVLTALIWLVRRAWPERRGIPGTSLPALVGIALGILAWQAFESLTLGGLSYPGFVWMLSIGLLVARTPAFVGEAHRAGQPLAPA